MFQRDLEAVEIFRAEYPQAFQVFEAQQGDLKTPVEKVQRLIEVEFRGA